MTKAKSTRGPKVVSRSHPRGKNGTKVSIREIVKHVEKGRLDPKTRAWSLETIQQGNLGGFGADKMAQAKAILQRLRKERPYVEDPVDGEFMQSSACTLDGCDGLKFLGGDCDDLVIAYLSAIESVGIEGALVAHSYDSHREHTHVLCAVRDDKRGTWVRCDPSTNDPFGTVSKPTRETFYGIPGGKVLADSRGTVNVKKVGSALGNIRPTGDFVGVGKPFGLLGEAKNVAEPVFQDVSDAFYAYMVQEVVRFTDSLEEAWLDLKYKHEQLKYASQMMNEAMGGGYELIEPDYTGTGEGAKLPRWTVEFEAYYQTIAQWVPVMISHGRDVQSGKRAVAWDKDVGKDGDVVILGKEGDTYVGLTDDNQFVVVTTGLKSGTTSGPMNPWLKGAAIIVGTLASAVSAVYVCQTAKTYINANSTLRFQRFMSEAADRYGPEKAKELGETVTRNSSELAQSEVDKEKVSPFSKIAETANTALNAVIAVGIGAVLIYGIASAVDWSKSRAKKATV